MRQRRQLHSPRLLRPHPSKTANPIYPQAHSQVSQSMQSAAPLPCWLGPAILYCEDDKTNLTPALQLSHRILAQPKLIDGPHRRLFTSSPVQTLKIVRPNTLLHLITTLVLQRSVSVRKCQWVQHWSLATTAIILPLQKICRYPEDIIIIFTFKCRCSQFIVSLLENDSGWTR